MSIEEAKRLPNEAAQYAIELLNFFSVLHFEGILEQILERAWRNSRGKAVLAMTAYPNIESFATVQRSAASQGCLVLGLFFGGPSSGPMFENEGRNIAARWMFDTS